MTFIASAPVRRMLALAILACVLASAWSLVVWPLIGLSLDRQTDITALAAQAGRFEAMIMRKPALERQARSLQAQLAAEGGLWNGTSAPAIAAGIQERLRQAVTDSGGRVKSTSEVSEASERGLRKIGVRFSIEGTLDTLQKTLAAVETTKPALFVDGFTVETAETEAPRDRPPSLDFDLSVAGYMRPSRP